MISSAQCRAARGLLGWTQEELARNALVSRATIAEFESNARWPIKNNLASIHNCMFAAGVEFLDDGKAGAGVRFREQRIEYKTSVQIVGDDAWILMRYYGEPFTCVVSREAIDDFHQFETGRSDREVAKAVSEILHHIIAVAERRVQRDLRDGKLLITSEILNKA